MCCLAHVVAVVLAYEAMETLPAVISGIRAQTVPPERLLVVDNGSADGTAEWLRSQDDLQLVRLPRNLGVGAGHNRGWDAARALLPTVDCLWALEHDTIPEERCLEQLLSTLAVEHSRGAKVAAVCPVQLLPGDSPPSDPAACSRGRTLTFNGPLLLVGAVNEVGPIREDFIVGHEDREYALRLDDHGYDIVRDPAACVFHRNKGARRRGPPSVARSYYASRNEAYLRLSASHVRWPRLTVVARAVGGIGRILVTNQSPRWIRMQARWQASFDALRGDLGWKDYSFLSVDRIQRQDPR